MKLSTLATHVENLAGARVLCVGDIMLDRFVYGHVERTSPEAPVPVLRIDRDHTMLGGAGNVVRNLVSLGAQAVLLSVVGDDPVGHTLTNMVGDEERVDPCLLVQPGRTSTQKTRFVASSQQLLRADSETTDDLSAQTIESLLRMADELIGDTDVIVLSDYAKGVLGDSVCRNIIERSRAAGKIVVVDPKGRDFERYRGANVITPNRGELGAAAGQHVETSADITAAARDILVQCGIENALVTRSHEGMSLVGQTDTSVHLPAQAREVFDVSGAGDTVVATLAAALAAGMDLESAAALANTAAGVVVGKAGTAVVHTSDLLHALRASDLSTAEAKVLPLGDALETVKHWRHDNLSIGFTNGCFDLLHPGHISLLRQSRARCDRLVVGLNSDNSIRRLKGEDRPVQGEDARAQVLASLETVDLVVIFDEDTPINLIETLRPDCLIKGADYTVDEVVGGDFVTAYGGQVVLAELEPGFSTTGTIKRLRA